MNTELAGADHGIGLVLAWYLYTAQYAAWVLLPRVLKAHGLWVEKEGTG